MLHQLCWFETQGMEYSWNIPAVFQKDEYSIPDFFLLQFHEFPNMFLPTQMCVQLTLVTFQKKTNPKQTHPYQPLLGRNNFHLAHPFFLVPFISVVVSSSSVWTLHGQGSSNDANDGTPNCHLAGITADFDQLLAKLFLWYPQAPITNGRKFQKKNILTSKKRF